MLVLLETGVSPWLIGGIAFGLMMIGLLFTVFVGASRPHS